MHDIKTLYPVKWDNINLPRMDSLPAQVARFRAGVDSIDLAIVVEFSEPDSIARTTSITAPVLRHLWIVPTGQPGERHRSTPLTTGGLYLWRERVAPGTLLYRAEAFAETATRGARVMGVIDATPPEFPLVGFGASDLVMSTGVTERAATFRRWTEIDIAPSVNRFARNQPVTFVWENYEFGERAGQAEYDATLTIRSRRGGIGKLAEIVGALARLARVERADDQVTFTFSRSIPYAAAFADWIAVQLPDAPRGEYDVSLTVTDRITGKQAARSTRMAIRDP